MRLRVFANIHLLHYSIYCLRLMFSFLIQSRYQSSPLPYPAYHWHTSDWRLNTRFSDTEDSPISQAGPGNRVTVTPACLEGSTQLLESDYYLGGYDIDSDCPASHGEVLLSEDLPALPSNQDFPEAWTPIAATLRLSHQDVLSSGSTASHPGPNFLPSQSHPSPPLCSGPTPQGEFRSSVKGNDAVDDVSAESLAPENVACVDRSERSLSLDGPAHLCGGETATGDLQLQTEVWSTRPSGTDATCATVRDAQIFLRLFNGFVMQRKIFYDMGMTRVKRNICKKEDINNTTIGCVWQETLKDKNVKKRDFYFIAFNRTLYRNLFRLFYHRTHRHQFKSMEPFLVFDDLFSWLIFKATWKNVNKLILIKIKRVLKFFLHDSTKNSTNNLKALSTAVSLFPEWYLNVNCN